MAPVFTPGREGFLRCSHLRRARGSEPAGEHLEMAGRLGAAAVIFIAHVVRVTKEM